MTRQQAIDVLDPSQDILTCKIDNIPNGQKTSEERFRKCPKRSRTLHDLSAFLEESAHVMNKQRIGNTDGNMNMWERLSSRDSDESAYTDRGGPR